MKTIFNSLAAPLVSVTIPVYNAAAYVSEAIGSLLNQTHRNLKVLVFNDGSKDNRADIIRALHAQDPRLEFFDSGENFGYVAHLNRGLVLAQGKYIARMDADDIALSERLARQVAFWKLTPKWACAALGMILMTAPMLWSACRCLIQPSAWACWQIRLWRTPS